MAIMITLNEYNQKFGFFQPVYSYDAPGAAVNITEGSSSTQGYGFQDFEVFGYSGPSATEQIGDPASPKGPKILGPYSDGFGHYYFFDQESQRNTILKIYSDQQMTTLVEERILDTKIEFGKTLYDVVTPTGVSTVLTLSGNEANVDGYPTNGSEEDIKDAALDKLSSNDPSFNMNPDDIDIESVMADHTLSHAPHSYASQAVVANRRSMGSSGAYFIPIWSPIMFANY